MKTLKAIAEQQQQARPGYFEDPEKERMLTTILSLTEEICVLRDRLDTCSKLADAGAAATDDSIDSFRVSDALREERLQHHTRRFETTLKKIEPR